jgi:hypothetical protein
MRTHIAAYGAETADADEQLYEPPLRILGVEVTGHRCLLTFFDHVDGPDADLAGAAPPDLTATVRPDTLLCALRLHNEAEHARTTRIPAHHDAATPDTAPSAVLLIDVIGDRAYLGVHRADETQRPIYPPRATYCVPVHDLIRTLSVHINHAHRRRCDPPLHIATAALGNESSRP